MEELWQHIALVALKEKENEGKRIRQIMNKGEQKDQNRRKSKYQMQQRQCRLLVT